MKSVPGEATASHLNLRLIFESGASIDREKSFSIEPKALGEPSWFVLSNKSLKVI